MGRVILTTCFAAMLTVAVGGQVSRATALAGTMVEIAFDRCAEPIRRGWPTDTKGLAISPLGPFSAANGQVLLIVEDYLLDRSCSIIAQPDSVSPDLGTALIDAARARATPEVTAGTLVVVQDCPTAEFERLYVVGWPSPNERERYRNVAPRYTDLAVGSLRTGAVIASVIETTDAPVTECIDGGTP